LPIFKTLLDNLYEKFQFPLGSVGYENSVTELFQVDEGWPSERYIPETFQIKADFVYVVADKNYVDLSALHGVITSAKKQSFELNG
jgi:hypothetical protein